MTEEKKQDNKKMAQDKAIKSSPKASKQELSSKEGKAAQASPKASKQEPSNKEDSAKTLSANDKEKADKSPSADEKKTNEKKTDEKKTVPLTGFFAFKMSMSTFYNEKGESVPVTALKYEPCFISQVKTEKKDGYSAVQLAFVPQKNKRCSKALIERLKPAGFKEGARFIKEIRQETPEELRAGQEIAIESLKKGDWIKISSVSKGKGFAGVMKRWNFAGGRATHGSKAHRRTGSIGQHTQPARVFPGRKMPGRLGFKKVSLSKVSVVEVFPKEGLIFVKGPVPGARNTLVALQKMS